MALIIENGTNVENANSLVTVDEADAYFSARGITTWTGEDAAKEAVLIRAMDYLNGLNWQGLPVLYDQPLCFPRQNLVLPSGGYWPVDEIPLAVKYSQCEIALRYLTGSDLTPDVQPGGQVIKEKVDTLEIDYAKGGTNQIRVQTVDRLLAPFLLSGLSQIPIIRG
jgi:hypothetical protein